MGLCNHLKLSARFFGPFKIIQRMGLQIGTASRFSYSSYTEVRKRKLGKNIAPSPIYLLLIKMVSFPRNPREICNKGVRSCGIDLSPKYVSSGKASKKKLLGKFSTRCSKGSLTSWAWCSKGKGIVPKQVGGDTLECNCRLTIPFAS